MMIDKKYMINDFVNSVQNKRGVLFIGSGISAASGFKSWNELLNSFYPKIYKISHEHYSLPQIAQFMANEINEFALKKYISDQYYMPKIEDNPYLNYITKININKIWTTNYDTLIEDMYGKRNCIVRVGDIDMAGTHYSDKIEIIKMHGCVTSIKDIIITQDDYDFYQLNHPNICRRLITDMNENSFLFIGYGYNDPDIHNILRTSQWSERMPLGRHYLVTKKDNSKLQKIWAKNLSRFGIYTIYINEYLELQNILQEISYKSRGKSIFVSGSHNTPSEFTKNIIKMIVNIFIEHDDVILIDGQSSGIGSKILSEYTMICAKKNIDRLKRIKSFPNPYALNKKFASNEKLIPILQDFREELFKNTQLFIVFDGAMGTKAEFELAKKYGCKIYPIANKYSPLMMEIINDSYVQSYMNSYINYFEKLKKRKKLSLNDIRINLSQAIQEL